MRGSGTTWPLTVLVLLVGAGLWLWPVVGYLLPSDSSAAPDPVTITDYQAEFDVSEDGELEAVERITASFPAGRHGIFRFWDVVDPDDDGHRLLPEDIEVTRDGRPEETELSWQTSKRYRVARIGDPDVFVSAGDHVYVIRYRIQGALGTVGSGEMAGQGGSWTEDADRAMLHWDLVPGGWQMSIDRAQLVVRLPDPPTAATCASGWDGEYGCRVRVGDDGVVRVAAENLPPRTPVTLRAALPLPPPDRSSLPWPAAWDMSFGRSVPWFLAVVLLAAALAVFGRALARGAYEEPPGLPVTYVPPDGMGPVEAYYVVHERVPDNALVATLLHLAERGMVRLEQLSPKQWRLSGAGTPEQWDAIDPVAREVGRGLGLDRGGSFEADGSVASGKQLKSVRDRIASTASQWGRAQGLTVGVGQERMLQVFVALAAVGAVALAFMAPGGSTLPVLPFAAFVVGGVPLLRSGVGSRRTPVGREAWSRSGGFHRMLSTDSAEARFDFAARRDLYAAYVPYAVGFGCADAWARKYQLTMGEEPPHRPGTPSARAATGGSVVAAASRRSTRRWSPRSAPTRPPSRRAPVEAAGEAEAAGAVAPGDRAGPPSPTLTISCATVTPDACWEEPR